MQSQKKRILWVTFHFPPRQSGGVFRPIRIYKYLDKEKFEVDFLTLSLLSKYGRAVRDESLLEEVSPKPAIYRVPSIEPEDWLRGLCSRNGKGDTRPKLERRQAPGELDINHSAPAAPKRLLKDIYGCFMMLFYFPDHLCIWSWLSTWKALWLHLGKRYDLIYTTSNPPGGHLPGFLLKWLGVRWVADFRDGGNLWNTRILGYPKGSIRKRVDFHYQRYVLNRADYIITQSELLKEELSQVYSVTHSRIRAIPNGYEEEDFRRPNTANPAFEKKPGETHLLHVGSWVINDSEIAKVIDELNALQSGLKASGMELFLHAVGKDLFTAEQRGNAIRFHYRYHGVIPHPLLLPYLLTADCYLLSASVGLLAEGARGVLAGKLWEYLRGGKPILLFGPKDEAWEIIKDAGVGLHLSGSENNNYWSADNLLRLIRETKDSHPEVGRYSWRSRACAMQEVFSRVLE